MPSQAMQDVIDTLRAQQRAAANQAPPALAELRAAFAPAAGRVNPVPGDMLVREVTAGGVPAAGWPSPCSWPRVTPGRHGPRPPC